MEIGRTFTISGVQYAIKQITGDRVDASKFKNGNLQRGRPCKFTYKQVAEALGIDIKDTPEVFEQYVGGTIGDDNVYETIPTPAPDPEKIKALIDSFEDTSTENDW